jgi:hypothetical protein
MEGLVLAHSVGSLVRIFHGAGLARFFLLQEATDQEVAGRARIQAPGQSNAADVLPHQPAASTRFAAATIFSTLGRYFISSRNNGMWVS